VVMGGGRDDQVGVRRYGAGVSHERGLLRQLGQQIHGHGVKSSRGSHEIVRTAAGMEDTMTKKLQWQT